jgi:hypothetical protein
MNITLTAYEIPWSDAQATSADNKMVTDRKPITMIEANTIRLLGLKQAVSDTEEQYVVRYPESRTDLLFVIHLDQ